MFLDIIAGARPNFIKIATIIKNIEDKINLGFDIEYRLVHTGQHYDKNMSGSFFTQLNIPEPHVNLNAGGGTQAQQTAAIMIAYENLLETSSKPDICLVVGDVTSTMACTIVAKKANIKVAHVEAGIRSNDMSMPEEINRIVTDSITDYFFTTSVSAGQNLINQGISQNKIFFVGNTMIDTLINFQDKFSKPEFWDKLNLQNKNYILVTLHRPANVDDPKILLSFINGILENTKDKIIVFPVHPRTKTKLENLDLDTNRIHFVDPQAYLQFNYLTKNAFAVITDSGGITEETTYMGIPCLTLRDNTERPETITLGTNELVGTNPNNLKPYLAKLMNGQWKKGTVPELWDGQTGERIINHIITLKLNE